MRIFRASYRGRDGQRKTAAKWYIELRDHLRTVRRFPAFTDKAESQALGRQIERLVSCKIGGEAPGPELSRWLEGLPVQFRERLTRIGLLDSCRAAAGKSLAEHLEDFRKSLEVHSGREHTKKSYARIKRILDGCKFRYWSDVQASQIEQYLGRLDLSVPTWNHYTTAFKSFCLWAVRDKRLSVSPVQHLRRLRAPKDEYRRALSFEEVCSLLESTEKAPHRFGMSGHERAVLYLAALQTGFRSSEVRRLTVGSFRLDDAYVRLAGERHRKQAATVDQLLKHKTAERLKEFFAGRAPEERAFNMPSEYRVSKMLKADLADAGIDPGESGSKLDFHSLRHTLATELDKSGASLKERMAITRHSDKANITLGVYTHVRTFDLRRAIERLPDYPWPGRKASEAMAATGTDGKPHGADLAFCLALSGGQHRTPGDTAGQVTRDSDSETPFSNGPSRIRTYDQGIMSPLTEDSQALTGKRLTNSEKSVLASCLALLSQIDSNLAWLTEHWPNLPESTRKQIIDAARAALNPGGTTK